ncbi:MAG: hypothetical protein M1460_02320 [Candidatus Thermoplasmatota archaeon]|jgi:predicted transcriptional regulator|nr:hypothetical protein [Candidatus Thermoplasmatota archaeon]MCL5987988.1 hypothetical protein [Candidatus Thermoplasmatota archaeon]
MVRDNLTSKISADMACCNDLLESLYSLGHMDVEVFYTLDQGKWKSVDEIASTIEREASTVYRSLQKLLTNGLAIRNMKTIKTGGYFYEYALTPVTTIEKLIQERIDCMKNGMEKLLADLVQEIGARSP